MKSQDTPLTSYFLYQGHVCFITASPLTIPSSCHISKFRPISTHHFVFLKIEMLKYYFSDKHIKRTLISSRLVCGSAIHCPEIWGSVLSLFCSQTKTSKLNSANNVHIIALLTEKNRNFSESFGT